MKNNGININISSEEDVFGRGIFSLINAVGFDNEKSLVLVDGGITNWTGKILSDSKEKCVTSGMGLEYLAKVYKK